MEELLKSSIAYAARIKDPEILFKSSSGGVFTVISNSFLDVGNAIVCSIYNYTSYMTEFRLVTDRETRDQALGSKYMQSIPGNIYKLAFDWLNNNHEKMLLFVGMGCQAESFRRYAEAMHVRDRVFIVDIVCHGSPSPKLWKDYAKLQERKYDGKMEGITFKDKRNGWKHPAAIGTINGNEISLKDYVLIYNRGCTLRPSCYVCPYSTTERKTDITIGDFWHIEDKMPDFYNSNGNSLILIHTKRGLELFDSIKNELDYRLTDKKNCRQINLERPTKKPVVRRKFWCDYQKNGVEFIIKKYGKYSLGKRVKGTIKHFIK